MRRLAPLPLLALPALALAQPSSVSVPQLSSSGRPAAQVLTPADVPAARAGRGVDAGQVGEAPRTAEGPPDLSTARQGRQLGAAPIGGWDRCDAASPEAGSEACREALERRLGEYAKPGSAPVTPEARLLILSNPPGAPASVSSATRRLGAPEAPPVDALAGSAAGDLAAALATRGQPDAPAAPTGVPSVVVTTPR